MGVRIKAFAVDLPQFDAFLNLTLAQLLCRYQKDGFNPGIRLSFSNRLSYDTYSTNPGGAVKVNLENAPDLGLLTDEEVQTIPLLQNTARRHFSTGSNYELCYLLEAFSHCRGINFIETLIHGHRRWWVGGVLQAASGVLEFNEYKNLERLFGKILQGWNCGFGTLPEHPDINKEGLPFVPEENIDFRFGLWTKDEALAAAALLSKVMKSSPAFTRPPGQIGISPDDSEWHQWVHGNVSALLRVPELNYKDCNVLAFIG